MGLGISEFMFRFMANFWLLMIVQDTPNAYASCNLCRVVIVAAAKITVTANNVRMTIFVFFGLISRGSI